MTVIIEIMSTCRENGCEIEHVKREALKRKKKKKRVGDKISLSMYEVQ